MAVCCLISVLTTLASPLTTWTPVRLLTMAREREVLERDLASRRPLNQGSALEPEGGPMAERAPQELRREYCPWEQAPESVASAANVLRGTSLRV